MLIDISYGWFLKKSANFHCQTGYWYHKQHNPAVIYYLCNNYFQLKVPFGVTFLQNIYFLRRTILWWRMKVWVPPRKAKIGQWVRFRWALSFPFERLKHLKTNCFKHSYIDPRKTDNYCEVTKWIHLMDSFNNLDFWVRGTNTPPTPYMTVNKLGRCDTSCSQFTIITNLHHYHPASLVMPNGDPRDGFSYPTLTLMIDSYNTLII